MNPQPPPNVPTQFYFGGGAAETILHPAVLVGMLVAMLLMWVLPRKSVVAPFLVCVFLTPLGQQLNVGGVHLMVIRLMILCGGLRVLQIKLSSGERALGSKFNSIDKVFLAWALTHFVAVILLWRESGAFVNQVGVLWTVLGGYFLMRCLIREIADIRLVIKVFAVLTIIFAACMIREEIVHRNVFSLLGGLTSTPEIREGRVRAQGAFQHPILAGAFASTLLPLFYWLWYGGKAKTLAVLGSVSACVMILSCGSSTPVLAAGAGVLALGFWPVRQYLRPLRYGLVLMLFALHLIMKAPVWFVISHIDMTGSSSGWHRAALIDTFIRHFADWWLVGTNQAFNWGADMWDTSNQFVQEGQTGGILALIFFILIVSYAFSRVGRAAKQVRGNPRKEWFVWFLGAALFSHVFAFFGISYFDQTQISWFALLASISVGTAAVVKSSKQGTAPAPSERQEIAAVSAAEELSQVRS